MRRSSRWLSVGTIILLLLTACRAAQPRATPATGAAKAATPTVGPNAPAAANTVVVVHWAAGHLMPPDRLLPVFASQFNATGHKIASGKRIEIRPVLADSAVQANVLVESLQRGALTDSRLGEPTLVTPVTDHWLSQVNHRAGRTVVDLASTEELAIAWTGLATYRGMAECLGWPNKEIGYADVVALRHDPKGWASCKTARVEWGQEPIMSFSDPNSSSSGRSVLFGLYSAASGKSADRLTPADVADPKVVSFVQDFQKGVDHYVPNTLVLQTKMARGYSHLYWVAEDTLVQLYQGKVPVYAQPGHAPQPLPGNDMVFIYPKEGSVAHNNPAGLVQAPWVSTEQAEAARQWIAFLREDAQQQAFMAEGFRPATRLPYACPICPAYGLDPNKPGTALSRLDPATAQAVVESWEDVKKPGIVSFVVDVSGSMQGAKLEQAKGGLVQALDGLARNTSVGLITFNNSVNGVVPIASIGDNKFKIAEQVRQLQAGGGTALYDALEQAVYSVDQAPGDPDTIRGVVVLSDGQATAGNRSLNDLVMMNSRAEKPIANFLGRDKELNGIEEGTRAAVPKQEIMGTGLRIKTLHPIHIFFVGVGEADLEIGRILAEATHSAFQGTTERSLANVLGTFGKYF
jgi:Ca-activated chloride channel family protein